MYFDKDTLKWTFINPWQQDENDKEETERKFGRVNQNGNVITLFRLIWIQPAYDCVDDFKIKKDKKVEGVGMDLKSKTVSLSDRDGCEMGVEEKYGWKLKRVFEIRKFRETHHEIR